MRSPPRRPPEPRSRVIGMLKVMRAPTFFLAALGLAAGLAFGQTAADPLDACAAEKDDAARLACFDRQMALRHGGQHTRAQAGGAAQAASAPPAVVHPQDQGIVPPPQAAQSHGQTAAAPPKVAPPPPDPNYGLPVKSRQAPAPVTATVARLVRVSRTEYAFQLDNGQIWKQTDSRPDLSVRVNDRVTINPGALGDFFFTTPRQQRIRVKRIR